MDAKVAAKEGDSSLLASRRYAAFISYSHQDAAVARWLHSSLERFRIPDDLRPESGKKRLAPIFRDEADLAGSASLSDAITQALTDSAALIVIGSPAAAKSNWVDQEILTFKRLGRADRVFCLIADGEPFASDRGEPERECFPLALRYAFDPERGLTDVRSEPLGVDLHKDGKRDALLRVAAGLLRVGFDRLKRREQRRRQVQLISLSVASVVGMAITSGLALMAYRAEQEARAQHRVAEQEANIARETTGFLTSLFQTADPFRTRGQNITAREVLDAGLTRIRTAFPKAPEIRASLIGSMGEVYQGLGLYKTSSQLFDELERSRLAGVLGPLRRLRFLNSYAETSYNSGDYAKAKALMYDAEPLLRQERTASDPVERGRTRNIMAQLAVQDGDSAAAERLLEQNLQELPSDPETRLQRALSYYTLGMLRLDQRDPAGARQTLDASLALRRETLGDDHPWVAEVENALGIAEYSEGRFLAAEQRWKSILPSYRKYFGEEHPEYSSLLQNYALTVLERGNFAEAEKLFLRSIAIDGKDKAPDHDDFAYSLNSLGLAKIGLGHMQQARVHLDAGIVIARKHGHRMRGLLLMNRADLACRTKDAKSAPVWLNEARVALAEDYPNEPWRRAQLENVALYCQALIPEGKLDPQGLVATLPEIDRHWGKDRLYAQEARWRIRQAFAAHRRPAPDLPM